MPFQKLDHTPGGCVMPAWDYPGAAARRLPAAGGENPTRLT
jgi:hypothetical protein